MHQSDCEEPSGGGGSNGQIWAPRLLRRLYSDYFRRGFRRGGRRTSGDDYNDEKREPSLPWVVPHLGDN
jgi:hypothetical protein